MSDQPPSGGGGDQQPSLWGPVPPGTPASGPGPAGGYPGTAGYDPGPGYGQGPGYGMPPAYVPTPPANPTNGFAVAALICGLLSLLTGITAILGIIFGFIALSQIKRSGEQGRGMAIAGLVISIVVLVISLIALVFVVVVFGWLINSFDANMTARMRGEMEQIAAAQERYQDLYGTYADRFTGLESVGYRSAEVFSMEIAYATERTYCVEAVNGAMTFHVTESTAPHIGSCPAPSVAG